MNEGKKDDGMCQDCRCCGMEPHGCWDCGGDGFHDVYEDDPLWYSPGDAEQCRTCGGSGFWLVCGGRCDANGKHGLAVSQ